jgi:polyferredoxin
MMFGLATKATFEVNVLKDRSPPFVRLSNGDVQNGYALKLVNKNTSSRRMSVSIEGLEGASVKVVGLENIDATHFDVPVAAHGVDRYRILVSGPADGNENKVNFVITDLETSETSTERIPFGRSK